MSWRFKHISALALLLIFTTYLGRVIALQHVHIINGVIIVHSHPGNSDNGTGPLSTPSSEHTSNELTFFSQISHVEASLSAFISVDVPQPQETGKAQVPALTHLLRRSDSHLHDAPRRAPPTLS